MSLKPSLGGAALSLTSSPTPHTLEFFLDYVCPFSAKQFLTFYNDVIPVLSSRSKSGPGVRVIFRQSIQPWHPSSTLVHEAGLAVLRVKPETFWEFSKALFEKQKEYFDANVVNETRNATYKRLSKLASDVTGVEEGKFYELLVISDKPDKDGGLNAGNQVTDDVKWITKTNRLVGVHVTPTVLFNGWPEGSISSGWAKKDWEEWIEKNLK